MDLHPFSPRPPRDGAANPRHQPPAREEPSGRRLKLEEDEEASRPRAPRALPWPAGPGEAGPEQGEASRYGRYLLIDSQGLPYTVLVEEAGAAGERAGLRKLYCCPVCSRTFEYLSYLQRHSITHSEHKPHVCRACGKAFKRTSHLERHKYTHAGRKPHQCPICQRSFRDAGELAHHQRVHTGERPFQCEDCHMRFGERNTLQRHIRRKHRQQPPTP